MASPRSLPDPNYDLLLPRMAFIPVINSIRTLIDRLLPNEITPTCCVSRMPTTLTLLMVMPMAVPLDTHILDLLHITPLVLFIPTFPIS